MQTVGRVMAEYEALPPSKQPSEILVDSIGIGAGVVDRMRELGAPVRGVNVRVQTLARHYLYFFAKHLPARLHAAGVGHLAGGLKFGTDFMAISFAAP